MTDYYYKSPIGILKITIYNGCLTKLCVVDNYIKVEDTILSREIKNQLSEYFLGKRKIFNVKLNLIGTDFQIKVWKELLNVKYANTNHYGEIAENMGNKNAQRAVGLACNKNPIMIFIPCHRIILKNGDIGGFACGTIIKRKLLELEKKNNN